MLLLPVLRGHLVEKPLGNHEEHAAHGLFLPAGPSRCVEKLQEARFGWIVGMQTHPVADGFIWPLSIHRGPDGVMAIIDAVKADIRSAVMTELLVG